jgi:3-methyladenine DNA glycosylase AlkD
MTAIQERLFALQDTAYRDFTAKLTPTVDPDSIIGVRLPVLRGLAKELRGTDEAAKFLKSLPHRYHEENHLHSFLLSDIRDFDTAMGEIERFLPYVDNWAVCDSLRVKAFAKDPGRALPYIERWIKSDRAFAVRFAILCLMNTYLGEHFEEQYLDMVAAVESEEYYVRMMVAWYFATALAKQYPCAVRVIEDGRLEKWTHNKAIQKAVESYRVSEEHKAYLRTLRRK